MSAWYIMTTYGFYPVEPATGKYVLGAPQVDAATLRVAGGEFKVIREGYSKTNRYVQSVELNGEPLNRYYITHDEIIAGGELKFIMGSDKSVWY